MGARQRFVISLAEVRDTDEPLVGGKAARLAVYYNDAVRPEDPYEFVGLLRGEPLLAVRRNEAIAVLANEVGSNVPLRDLRSQAALETGHDPQIWEKGLLEQLRRLVRSDEGDFGRTRRRPHPRLISGAASSWAPAASQDRLHPMRMEPRLCSE